MIRITMVTMSGVIVVITITATTTTAGVKGLAADEATPGFRMGMSGDVCSTRMSSSGRIITATAIIVIVIVVIVIVIGIGIGIGIGNTIKTDVTDA